MNDPVWLPLTGATPAAQAIRVIERCQALSRFTECPDSITRTFLSPRMHDVHHALGFWMEALGMEASVDSAGNLRGVYRSAPGPTRRRLIIGSHLDTVPNAGAYDGILGVVLGLALIEALNGKRLAFEIEVVGFSEEEGVRFGVPFLGSRAFVGDWPEALLATVDRQGTSVRQAILDFGLNPDDIGLAEFRRNSSNSAAYLEIHIEQGPVLESRNLPLAVVESIAGQSRCAVQFQGQANHAGTTPMALRHDALAGAAEWVAEVERAGRATPGLVATVGRLQVNPGAGNVVPGLAEASLDVRHASDIVRHGTVKSILDTGAAIAQRRRLQFSQQRLLDQPAVPCDPRVMAILHRAIAAAGYPDHTMVSGAGHDAMVIAPHLPTAMLFLRSPGGISHHPSETVLPADVAAAIATGRCFLQEWEKEF